MARAEANKLYRTFVKGLVTEASPLTYPEDTSYDELNTILSRKGNRTRRLGQDYTDSSVIADHEVTDNTEAQGEFVWKAVGQNADTNFLVIQKGCDLTFFDISSDPVLGDQKSFSVNLCDHLRPGAVEAAAKIERVQFASGKGFLWVVSDKIEPLFVEYDEDMDSINVTEIVIQIRDFDGLNDGLTNDEEPLTLSKEHHYNLLNQGWVTGSSSSNTFTPVAYSGYTLNPEIYSYNRFTSDSQYSYQYDPSVSPISKFYTALSKYPGNNKQWWLARAAADDTAAGYEAGDFLPEVLDKLFSGNNRAPTGHFVLNAFNRDRSLASGVSNIDTEVTTGRPNSVCFFAGRAWYGQGSNVYYSQILDTFSSNKIGLCFQEADPTAEDISDLIDSDGGEIPIPEIAKVIRLMPLANGVVVFATNGVWFVSGGDQAFSATNISVSKISSLGTANPFAIIEADETIFWWGETGIQAMQQASGQFGPIPGKLGNTNITEQTIQTLYFNIPDAVKTHAKGYLDPRNNRLLWLYRSGDDLSGNWEYNRVLWFDLTLQAFNPWEFSYEDGFPVVNGLFLDIGYASFPDDDTFFDEPSNLYYIVNVPSTGMVASKTVNTNCADWENFDDTGLAYESYLEAGYELMQDTMRKKQVIYLVTHLERFANTSCRFRTKWDWSNSAASNKWSTDFEAYRERPNAEFHRVVTNKHKVRGNGKAIQFRFGTNEIGKNFNLLGWAVAFSGNTKP